MNLIDEPCLDGLAMTKSAAISRILVALDKITMDTTISAAPASNDTASNNNAAGGWIVMTGNENKEDDNSKNGTTSTNSLSKPRPETTIIQSRSFSKSAVASTAASRAERGSRRRSSSKQESLKRSSKRLTECGELSDYKLTEVNSTLGTIHDSVYQLASEFRSLKMLVERQEKMQRIAFAIENCDYGSFEYYNGVNFCHHQSHHLVKSILFAFRLDDGYELPTECSIDQSFSVRKSDDRQDAEEKNMNGEKLFHESLVTQIHALTGIEPRIEKIDGADIIWYS
jgi:hypothetical protein